MTLRIEKLSGPQALFDLAPEWDRLDRQLAPRTPFTSPLWIGLWWKHFRQSRRTARDEFFCHVVRDDDAALVAVAPLMVTHRPGVGPLRMRVLQFFGADPSITELRGVICRAEHQDAVIEALVQHFHERRGEWDVFRWNGMRDDGCAYRALMDRREFVADSDLPDYILHLPQSWEEVRASVSSNMRKNVRKAYEFLERDGHAFVFRAVEDPAEVPEALARFLVLHAARAGVADMIYHPNKFEAPRPRAFLTDYVTQMAEQGMLRLFELEISGTVVASRLAFVLGNELYLYFAGYDPAWRKYSVMTTLMAEVIKWAIGQRLELINLSTGRDLSKLRWKPAEIMFRDAVQVSPTARGQLAFLAYDRLVRRPRLRFLQERAAALAAIESSAG
jgi:CelD/BcsL family acetyltransferase involved in cellulose biosynthesis